MTFLLADGEEIQLGGSKHMGGEGKIYEHPQRPGHLIKIYREPNEIRAAKLEALIEIGQGAGEAFHQVASWPLEPVYARAKGAPQIVGFVMRRAPGVPIHTLYGPRERKTLYPHLTWKDLILVARNAAAAFHQLHATGVVLGDINEGNFLVETKTGLVSLIDCDSYQTTHEGRTFLCPVGVGIWTPPELHGVDFKRVSRTVNHDSFGLAVLLFQLLFIGRHPFASSHEGNLDEAIRRGLFSYAESVAATGIKPPPLTLKADDVGPDVFNLFERAFLAGPGHEREARPTPEEWYHALDALEKSLVPCPSGTLHMRREGQVCPFCRLEEGGYSAFVFSGFAHKGELTFDEVVRFKDEIEAVQLATFEDERALPTATSTEAPVRPGRRKPLTWFGSYLEKNQRAEREKELGQAQIEIAEAAREIRQFLRERQEQLAQIKWQAAQAYQDLLAIPLKEQQEMRELEDQRRPAQLRAHLKKFEPPRHIFNSFQPGLDATLRAYGVESAFEVINEQRPPGVPVDLWTQLVRWSTAREKEFIFDHQAPVAATALLALKNRWQRERMNEQVTLSGCYQSARNLAAETHQHLELLTAEFRNRAMRVREAERQLEE